jgi:hypothetical protein
MLDVTNPSGIRHFVRNILGCGCPEEVFDDMVLAEETMGAGLPAVSTLLVGHRLLVVMLACEDRDRLRSILPQLVSHFRQKRDARGYNRVRFVIASSQPAHLQPAAELCFAGLQEIDDRMHLHILPPEDLAGVA